MIGKGSYSPEDQSIFPKETAAYFVITAPPIISDKCPISIFPLCLTSHFMCVQIFHMVNIDVPAGVGAPLLDTQLLNMQVRTKPVSLAKWGTCSILQRIHPKTHVF